MIKGNSRYFVFGIWLILAIYRMVNVSDQEISWDVLGYYLPLPASIVHDDAWLNDISWLEKLNEEKELAGTLYMVAHDPEGRPMYFFLFGMALFYFPFFLIAHFLSFLIGLPMDGFSVIYQYSMVMGGLLYTLVGLLYLNRILQRYFRNDIVIILMLLMVFGTNFIHHMTDKNLETVNILFTLCCLVIWNTIKWHEEHKFMQLLAIAVFISLMVMIKPSEGLVILIPLLWNVRRWHDLAEKFKMIWKFRFQCLLAASAALLIASPQLIYWEVRTGHFVYDTYQNAGVGLDLAGPHMFETLFSYRKGWFIYTPLAFFAVLAFIPFFKRNKEAFLASLIYFIASFYIISSWTEWWYGGGYSIRPLIVTYPILSISLGYGLQFVFDRGRILRSGITSILAFLLFLNQFQWWQFKKNYIDPYRMTKAAYWNSFLKTDLKDLDRSLLLISRDFSGDMHFDRFDEYTDSLLFELPRNKELKVEAEDEFPWQGQWAYGTLTEKDHLWLELNIRVRFDSASVDDRILATFSMERHNGSYGWHGKELTGQSDGHWTVFKVFYLTPEIRDEEDELKVLIWNRDKRSFELGDLNLKVYEQR